MSSTLCAQSFTTLYRFSGHRDGQQPASGIIYENGVLYGTTIAGGTGRCGCGTIFMVDPMSGTETVLYRAKLLSPSGNFQGGLTDVGGMLYGGGYYGGIEYGTIFEFNPKTRALRVLYNLQGGALGANPDNTMVYKDGAFYGTTANGGTNYFGTIFKFVKDTRTWTVLHSFDPGIFYTGGLTVQDGMLLGSTVSGGGQGTRPNCGPAGCGTIFQLDTATGNTRIIHAFSGLTDGSQPNLPIIVGDTIYVSVAVGGARGCAGAGCGGIVSIARAKDHPEKMIYTFQRMHDTRYPDSQLLDINGALYGETGSETGQHGCEASGGGCGTLFRIDLATGAETILYRFTGRADGGIPIGGLTYHDGALYGATQIGANRAHCRPYGCGTVFKYTLAPPATKPNHAPRTSP